MSYYDKEFLVKIFSRMCPYIVKFTLVFIHPILHACFCDDFFFLNPYSKYYY